MRSKHKYTASTVLCGENVRGIIEGITDPRVPDIQYPKCLELFEVEFNPSVDESFCHAIERDGTGIRG